MLAMLRQQYKDDSLVLTALRTHLMLFKQEGNKAAAALTRLEIALLAAEGNGEAQDLLAREISDLSGP